MHSLQLHLSKVFYYFFLFCFKLKRVFSFLLVNEGNKLGKRNIIEPFNYNPCSNLQEYKKFNNKKAKKFISNKKI